MVTSFEPRPAAPSHAPPQETSETPTKTPLGVWLDKEKEIAFDRLLANIAPGGRNAENAAPGSVIASPSREHPDYYFQWVRDAAITIQTLVDTYADDPASDLSSQLVPILDAYASLQYHLQRTPNPSGTFSDLSGLGEPKFHADGSAFVGNWGRPQRDGPALRALTLMGYLRAYNASHPALWASSGGSGDWFRPFYDAAMPPTSIIKADLEYVSHYWREPGFDLWEEIRGIHFFTAMVQLRALREGAELAAAFGDHGAEKWYTAQADEVEAMVPQFWDAQKGHLVETLHGSRSGLDCGLLLGSLHGTSPITNASNLYPPHSDEILVSLLTLVRDQRARFPINAVPTPEEGGADALRGTGLGRYPEDVYDGYGTTVPNGGNPWFLCTAAAAEVLYRTRRHLVETRSLMVSEIGTPFWRALLAGSSTSAVAAAKLEPGKTYTASDPTGIYSAAVTRLKEVGDSFLAVVRRHSDGAGALSEQFDRLTGFERGAKDLTWSYGALLGAVRARG
ncbi:Glucoamylase, intracellular sporulation-specific [Coniosporium tulheliwenetii]|uniref:Glucoamylase, intracellular sporulation-specific n=1 Tax=Coniosporium tulheliwenetii TaxID=3383036 RepID=A0ACC2ZB07_9PEZI|nr:Glucoamylase, intracellular sporulation-specific [Cladosporium sp. JES 115]